MGREGCIWREKEAVSNALSSQSYREDDIDGVFDSTFSIKHNRFGKNTNHNLKPNGQDIPVTNEIKKE